VARAPRYTDVEFLRFPHLPGVELRHSCYRESVFRTHTHPAWSVGVIESGSTTFTLGGRKYHATRDQLVVIAPGLAHACNPTAGESIDYMMFYLSREWLMSQGPDAGFPAFDAVIDDLDLVAQWTSLCRDFARDPGHASREALKEAVSALVARHARWDSAVLSESNRLGIENVKRFLAEHLDRRVTLDELAGQAGMSRSHLTRVFAASEGLPPHTYHNQLRVDRAKTLLAAGAPLSQVAASAGFSDQSHLTRVFREFTGATPSQYQSAHRHE